MGSVAEAVLEFDESVQVPWRPPLAGAPRPVSLVPPLGNRRPRAARAARLTVPPPIPAPPATPAPPARRSSSGSTAVGHTCVRCSGSGQPVSAVRLTRRARRLLGVLVAAVAILLGVWVGSVVGAGDEHLQLVSDSSVVVQQGDTLWSIARSVAGDQDVRLVVDLIQELNGMHDAGLRPGQVLRLP